MGHKFLFSSGGDVKHVYKNSLVMCPNIKKAVIGLREDNSGCYEPHFPFSIIYTITVYYILRIISYNKFSIGQI